MRAVSFFFFSLSHTLRPGVSSCSLKSDLLVHVRLPEVDQRAGVSVHAAHFGARSYCTCVPALVKGLAENKQTE